MIFEELRAIQLHYGYLPKAELEHFSQRSQIPLYQIHSVASFYPHFHLTPPSRAEVLVCADMSCRLNGACELRAELAARFAGTRAEDVQIKDVSCLGRCDRAPAVAINDAIFVGVSADQVEQLARRGARGEELHTDDPETTRVACASDPYRERETYGAVRKLVSTRDYDGVLASLKEAELRGMGGAGFPAWMKWDLVRKQAGPEKYVVCNADESEPGTIKDRFILSHLPHLVAEGMMIAGLVTGAKKGFLYIRHEYPLQEEIFGKSCGAA